MTRQQAIRLRLYAAFRGCDTAVAAGELQDPEYAAEHLIADRILAAHLGMATERQSKSTSDEAGQIVRFSWDQWTAQGHLVVDSEGYHIAEASSEQIANIIALAPDMRAALETVIKPLGPTGYLPDVGAPATQAIRTLLSKIDG